MMIPIFFASMLTSFVFFDRKRPSVLWSLITIIWVTAWGTLVISHAFTINTLGIGWPPLLMAYVAWAMVSIRMLSDKFKK